MLAHQPDLAPGQGPAVAQLGPFGWPPRKAANAAASGPLLPWRQLIRRQSALASMVAAATGASLGTGGRRGRPVAAVGQRRSTVGGSTFWVFRTPTAQVRPRALRPCRKAAPMP
jgi:hypothetical protein